MTIFNVKDKTKEDRHHNLTYSVKSSMKIILSLIMVKLVDK